MSSMFFTMSRAIKVCKDLPDPDYVFMKLTDALRTMVDHLATYKDFTGMTLVGNEYDMVDLEDWVTGDRQNQDVEGVMRDTFNTLMNTLYVAPPGAPQAPMPDYEPTSPTYVPYGGTVSSAAAPNASSGASPMLVGMGNGASPGGVLFEFPLQSPFVPSSLPFVVPRAPASSPEVGTVPRDPSSRDVPRDPRRRVEGAVSIPVPVPVPVHTPVPGVAAAPPHRVERVEHVFIPATAGDDVEL